MKITRIGVFLTLLFVGSIPIIIGTREGGVIRFSPKNSQLIG